MTSTDRRDLFRQLANVVLIPFGIIINVLPRIGGSSVGAVARETEPLLAAAGWAFSIWSVIFLGQLAYAIYQVLPRHRASPMLRRIGWFTAAVGLLEGVWSLAFTQHAFGLAWAIICALLACLIVIELRIGNAFTASTLTVVRLPFAINLGWIFAATLLNTSQYLFVTFGWQGHPLASVVWASALVIFATAASVVMVLKRHNTAFGVVTAWALAAIASYRHIESPALGAVAIGGAAVALIAVAIRLVQIFVLRRSKGAVEGRAPARFGVPRHAS